MKTTGSEKWETKNKSAEHSKQRKWSKQFVFLWIFFFYYSCLLYCEAAPKNFSLIFCIIKNLNRKVRYELLFCTLVVSVAWFLYSCCVSAFFHIFCKCFFWTRFAICHLYSSHFVRTISMLQQLRYLSLPAFSIFYFYFFIFRFCWSKRLHFGIL